MTTESGTGFVVLHRESDLELIVSCWPAATLANTARAHWPEVRSRDQAVIRAAAAFGEVPGALILSWGEAIERIRDLTRARRAKQSMRSRQHQHPFARRSR